MEDKIFNKSESDTDTPVAQIPYIAYESAMARMERQIKRLWAALVVAIVAVVACNLGYIWYLNQYDFTSYEISSADGGNANYIGQDGDIYNGTSPSEEENKEKR